MCRSLEDKNVEGRADIGSLACEASEKFKDSIRAICYFELRFWGSGAEASAVIKEIPELLKRNLALLEYSVQVSWS